jgi:hypothetical protein
MNNLIKEFEENIEIITETGCWVWMLGGIA